MSSTGGVRERWEAEEEEEGELMSCMAVVL